MKSHTILRRTLIALGSIFLIAAIGVGAAVLAVESDWAEQRIERVASEWLGRDVALNDIDIRFAWPPRVHLQTLRIANPEWAKTRDLVAAEDVSVQVKIGPLFKGRIVLESLTVARGRAGLEQQGKRATWQLGPEEKGPSRFQILRASLGDVWIYYGNDPQETALHIHATGELGPQGDALALQGKGTYKGDAAHGTANIPSVGLASDRPLDLSADLTVGATTGAIDGTFELGSEGLQSMNAKLDVRGQSLEHLSSIFGVNAPATPPYRIQGHLQHARSSWTFDPFAGEVGDSDLRGRWSYDASGAKPTFTANITAKRLDLDDLAPLFGAPPAAGPGETASPKQRQAARGKDRGLLPNADFETERWDEMNADVRLEAAQVIAGPQIPVGQLTAHLTLEESVLRVQPLAFDIAGGRIESTLSMDPREDAAARGELTLEARDVKLSRLFRSKVTDLGALYAKARLAGRGTSLDRLFGTASGEVSAAVTGGQISALLLEAAGLDLAEALAVIASKNVKTRLRCAVAQFEVDSGVATAKAFVIDTRDTLVRIDGTINFDQERFDLVAHPHPKDPSLFSLQSPLVVSGPLSDPTVRPKAGPLAARIGAAGLLALVNPLLAIVPFVETGSGEDANCGALVREGKRQRPDS
jgi:uncharacterized protein involved in outer membrane biogenesis